MCSREFDTNSVAETDRVKPAREPAARGPNTAKFARQIIVALKRRPGATILVEDGGVTILRTSSGGPDVTARVIENSYVLAIGGWHDEFASITPMIEHIEAVLDGSLRVRRDDVDGKVWRTALERHGAGGVWETVSAIEFPRAGVRRSVATTYLQNCPLAGERDGA